ncbi:epoxide hydrolase [Arthrobacter sp. ATA002]|uniref:epoxide hydrolase family protein n=1 Tax=Arthrobacter sp. ATA002 TaxID=2991715 RepID=UPI0022A6906A|nr:epoxide hydrolase [Arthrobacter sp. ATA002]WAP52199.1 epoxide hydrolase [Arthrobacter sp. ATA002]
MSEIKPFTIYITDNELANLKRRIEDSRLPEPETVLDDSQGVSLERMHELLGAWRTHDWRSLESRWNAIPHFRTRIDGLDIAFWHVRSAEPHAVPLLMTHGWPGSVLEFQKIIVPLTDPVSHGGSAEDAFDIIVPALPGFGFSERPRELGWDVARTARAWAELMTRLGYDQFMAHGGDWGAFISTELAVIEPERVSHLHLTMPIASPLPSDRATADEAETRKLAQRDNFMATGPTHVMAQGALPQTLGYSFIDSPVGLAAWLDQALVAFSDTRPEAGGGVSLNDRIDNIALYWLTATGASTARWYWETIRTVARGPEEENARPVTVPTSFTLFPGEPYPNAHRWAERRYLDIVSWNEMEYGGHYPGWEQPTVLVVELRNASRHLRGE